MADIGSLTLGTIVSDNDFTVSSAGALDLGTAAIGGSMTATSSGGDITQVVLLVLRVQRIYLLALVRLR